MRESTRRRIEKSARSSLEPDERLELVLYGLTSRLWYAAGAWAALGTRWVLLTDRNVYVCRRPRSKRMPVVVKYQLGSVELSFKRPRLRVGDQLLIVHFKRRRTDAQEIVARANARLPTASAT